MKNTKSENSGNSRPKTKHKIGAEVKLYIVSASLLVVAISLLIFAFFNMAVSIASLIIGIAALIIAITDSEKYGRKTTPLKGASVLVVAVSVILLLCWLMLVLLG